MSCTVESDYLTLLQYHHNESKTDIQDQFAHGISLYYGSAFRIWKPFVTNLPNFTKTDIPNELEDTKEIPMRHLLMTVYKMKRAGDEKHSVSPYLFATLTYVIIGSASTIVMYYHCKKISARISLRLTKNSGKTMKTPV